MADRERPSALAGYRAVLRSRMRAQRSYRMSFGLDVAAAFLMGAVEFAEVWVIMSNVTALGGLTLPAMILLFGLGNVCWSIADLLVGHLDTLPGYLREGKMEAFYLRPQPILAQLMTSDISLRRLGRLSVGAASMAYGLAHAGVSWDWRAVALLVVAIPSGAAIFAGLFVWAAALQFYLVSAPEMSNAFTYGGSYASRQPLPVFRRELRVAFGLVVPVAFVGYLPTVALLGMPGPPGFPAWWAWLAPVAAAWVWGVGLWGWRRATRHYQGGGG